jgi:hypothetical protein
MSISFCTMIMQSLNLNLEMPVEHWKHLEFYTATWEREGRRDKWVVKGLSWDLFALGWVSYHQLGGQKSSIVGQDKFQVRLPELAVTPWPKLEPQGKISSKNNSGEFGRLFCIIPCWIQIWIEIVEEPRSVWINCNNNPSLPFIVLALNT